MTLKKYYPSGKDDEDAGLVGLEFDERINKYMEDHKDKSYADAMLVIAEEDKEFAKQYINQPPQKTQTEVKKLSKSEYKDAETAFLQEVEDMCFMSGKPYGEVFTYMISKPRHKAFADKQARSGQVCIDG